MTVNEKPSLGEFASLIVRVGLTSFGGGVSGWMMRLVVEERGWVTEAEFLTGLSLCQVFPGINVLNLSIWLGYRLHGGLGAVAGALAMLVPPGIVLLLLGAAAADLTRLAWARAALNGVAAAAIGLTGAMGVRAARRSMRRPGPALVGAATFVLIAGLRLPLVPVVAAMAVVGIGLALWEGGDAG